MTEPSRYKFCGVCISKYWLTKSWKVVTYVGGIGDGNRRMILSINRNYIFNNCSPAFDIWCVDRFSYVPKAVLEKRRPSPLGNVKRSNRGIIQDLSVGEHDRGTGTENKRQSKPWYFSSYGAFLYLAVAVIVMVLTSAAEELLSDSRFFRILSPLQYLYLILR